VRGKPVDARTDIYLLALAAHYLFTGKPASSSEQLSEVIHDQMNTPLPEVTTARPEFPPALDDVLARMGAKDPDQRPASMVEVLRLLEQVRPKPLHPAPLIARGAAAMVDWFLLFLVTLAILGVDKGLLADRVPGLILCLLWSSAVTAYALLPELRWGTSAGKSVFNLGVVRADGTRAGTWALAARFLLRYPMVLAITTEKDWSLVDVIGMSLQCLVVGAGVVCYFFSQGRTLSDLITRTRVVYRLPGGGPRTPAPPEPARR